MRLWIDTDAGIDDAEAILMALRDPRAQIEGISTVSGNVGVEQVNLNVCTVLAEAGKTGIPIYSGAALPLVEPWLGAGDYHMADGLGDWDERPACTPEIQAEHAVNALIRATRENPGEISVIALGPLTNIALALRLDPELPQRIKHFVFMGGSVNAVGNSPRMGAEFNIYTDPEAAYMVLKHFPTSTMLSWDVTCNNPIPWPDYDRLCAIDSSYARFFKGINDKVSQHMRHQTNYGGHLLPDPLAMAIMLDPSLILKSTPRYVTVELAGAHSRGQTMANYTHIDYGPANVEVVEEVDMAGVLALYEQMLRA